jgi:enolase
MMNILNGGQHAAGSTDIQESMIIPAGAKSYAEAVQIGAEVFHELKKVLQKHHYVTTVGDEGGFAPAVKEGNREALDLIIEAIKQAGYEPGKDVVLALDVASSELYKDEKYEFASEEVTRSSQDLIGWYEALATKYPIVSIEDGLAEDDWKHWHTMTATLGKKLQLVGDDLLVTNTERIDKAIHLQAGNAVLIKPNQIGTLSETIDAIQMAQRAGWNAIVSHRSGETEDVTIAHIAIGTGAGQIKTGSLSRSDRVAKHNEIMRVESIDPTLPFSNPFH